MTKINTTNLFKSLGVGIVCGVILHFVIKWNISNILISIGAGLVTMYYAYGKFNGSNLPLPSVDIKTNKK